MPIGKKIIFVFFLIPARLFAQDLTGLWQGQLYNDTTKQYYKYEIGISKDKKGKLSGFSHTWFLLDDKQYYGVKKLKIHTAPDGKIVIEDDGLIANNYPVSPAKHVRQVNVLTLEDNGTDMVLSGPFSTTRTKQWHSLTGSILITKKTDFRQSALVPHLQELGKDNDLSFVKEENEMLAAIERKTMTEQLRQIKDPSQAVAINTTQKPEITQTTIPINEVPKQPDIKKPSPAIISANETASVDKNVKDKPVVTNKEAKETAAALSTTTNSTPDKEKITTVSEKPGNSSKPATKGNETAAVVNAKEKIITRNTEKPAAVPIAEKSIASNTQNPVNKVASIETTTITTSKVPEVPVSTTASTATTIEANIALQKNKNTATTIFSPSTIVAGNIKGSNAPAADVSRRISVLQKTVNFKTDSLQLALYDNGEVDGDTVSILMNGELIMARQGLSTNAIRKTIYIDPAADSIELVMYAENLGSIAPNTGLLVVRDGKDLYEIRFSGDLQKNASIVFLRKKE